MKAPSLRLLAFVLALSSAVGVGACSRAHLTPTHGRAYHEVFAAQDANPQRKQAQSVHGLDSNEAAIIAGSYRKALGPKSEASASSGQMLMINPQAVGSSNNATLQPSVPSGN